MSDLPTREEAQAWIEFWHGSRAKIREFIARDLVRARADGVLLTADEWRDQEGLIDPTQRLAQRTSVREWARRRGISLDALRNPDAEMPDHPFTLSEDE